MNAKEHIICHKDGTFTYWPFWRGSWVFRATTISDEALATFHAEEQERVRRKMKVYHDINKKPLA